MYEFGDPQKLSKVSKQTNDVQIIKGVSERFQPEQIRIAQRDALLWGTQQQEAIEYGNVIHEILSFIHTAGDLDQAIIKSAEMGMIKESQKAMVRLTLQEIIMHPELEEFFMKENKVFNEQSIIRNDGNTVKPDRMVLTPEHKILLLDYKTGKHQSKYQLQLENYREVIEKMNFKVTKKVLVYIGKSIEVIHL